MATSVEDCERIVAAVDRTGRTYMMMETFVYAREFLYPKQLHGSGELGRLQFLRAGHMQDMAGCPGCWPGQPSMWYATHCVGPVLALTDARAGSGTIREEPVEYYGSPFAVESAHVRIRDRDLVAHVHRSLFDVARQDRESIDVYGSRRSFEWALVDGGRHVLHTAKCAEADIPERIEVPDFAERLPEPIRRFTTGGVYDDETHLSFTQGGSHPHLVHEFVSALVEQRAPFPNARRAANWTCVGLCAHESALRGGALVRLPKLPLQ